MGRRAGGRRGKSEGRRLTPLEGWAQSIAAGVPDDLYWQLTPPEINALLEALHERDQRRERAAALRAGLIAATIRNVRRTKRSDKVWQPGDFLKKEKEEVEILSPEQFARRMSAWADTHNSKVAQA